MLTETAHKLWETYPGWHMHCDVKAAGADSYHITMTLLDADGNPAATIEHTGSGNLVRLKEVAFQRLIDSLDATAV